jgi:predicted metal-dependent peptidase
MTAAEYSERAAELAGQVLQVSRNALMLRLRFLDAALIRFVPAAVVDLREIATDGHYLFYNAQYILLRYKKVKDDIMRDYLHVCLHCVFRHLFVGKNIKRDVWDLASDIAVEALIEKLAPRGGNSPETARQKELIDRLYGEITPLSAEKLYRHWLDENLPPQDYARIRRDFYADDHSGWYEENNGVSENITGKSACEETDDGNGEAEPDKQKGENGDELTLSRDDTEQKWKEIGERVQLELETMNDRWGQSVGDMVQQLRAVNRERYNYIDFLRRFSVLGENIEVNDEEFDYVYYTYGLSLYQNLPLVEPLEYKETKRVREFVIALDTSQSVEGATVQAFVQKTYNILKQSESFFTRVNIHILQCGASVLQDAKIENDDDFDNYIKDLRLYGFGGTDFRPAFEYVNKLIDEHELTNFRGMIYFTDGFGSFPTAKPDYDAAFVFIDNGVEIPDIPVWAIKVVLPETDIELL